MLGILSLISSFLSRCGSPSGTRWCNKRQGYIHSQQMLVSNILLWSGTLCSVLNRQFMIITGLNEHNSLVNLLQNISPTIENDIDIVEHSQYYSDVNFINMIQQVNDDNYIEFELSVFISKV